MVRLEQWTRTTKCTKIWCLTTRCTQKNRTCTEEWNGRFRSAYWNASSEKNLSGARNLCTFYRSGKSALICFDCHIFCFKSFYVSLEAVRAIICLPDSSFLIQAAMRLIRSAARQRLCGETNENGADQFLSFREAYLQVVEALGVEKRLNMLQISKGHLSMQTILLNNLYYLKKYLGKKLFKEQTIIQQTGAIDERSRDKMSTNSCHC